MLYEQVALGFKRNRMLQDIVKGDNSKLKIAEWYMKINKLLLDYLSGQIYISKSSTVWR